MDLLSHVNVVNPAETKARQIELRRDYEARYLAFHGHPLPVEFGDRWWPQTVIRKAAKALVSVS